MREPHPHRKETARSTARGDASVLRSAPHVSDVPFHAGLPSAPIWIRIRVGPVPCAPLAPPTPKQHARVATRPLRPAPVSPPLSNSNADEIWRVNISHCVRPQLLLFRPIVNYAIVIAL